MGGGSITSRNLRLQEPDQCHNPVLTRALLSKLMNRGAIAIAGWLFVESADTGTRQMTTESQRELPGTIDLLGPCHTHDMI